MLVCINFVAYILILSFVNGLLSVIYSIGTLTTNNLLLILAHVSIFNCTSILCSLSTWTTMAILTDQQSFAENAIWDGHNVVLTGQAGTGKSFMIRDVVSLHKFMETNVALLCTTGIACMQYFDLGATTVHRY